MRLLGRIGFIKISTRGWDVERFKPGEYVSVQFTGQVVIGGEYEPGECVPVQYIGPNGSERVWVPVEALTRMMLEPIMGQGI